MTPLACYIYLFILLYMLSLECTVNATQVSRVWFIVNLCQLEY